METNSLADIPAFGNGELHNLHREIGRGGMGTVSLYQWKIDDQRQGIHSGQMVAVKHLDYSSDRSGVIAEAKILWPLHTRCNYILRMFGIMNTNGIGIGIVLDFMKYGNIAKFFSTIGHGSNEMLNSTPIWKLKTRIAKQVCEGMEYLHGLERPILHCDLKAANVLLDTGLNVKICDFGLAKIKRLTTKAKSDEVSKGRPLNFPAGTVSHVAPELLRVGKHPTKESDVYSFGILLWELLTGHTPYGETPNQVIIINDVIRERRPEIQRVPATCPDILRTMMTDAWCHDPDNRPAFSELRRRVFNEDRDMEDSVEIAKTAWERHETQPKEPLTRRNTNNCGPSYVPFSTQHFSGPPIRQPAQHLQMQQNNLACDDPHPSEVMISNESNISEESNKSSKPGSATLVTEDHRAPLIDVEPSSPAQSKICRYVSKGFAVCFVLLCVSGAAIAGRYLFPNTKKGCCLNCFNPFEPGIQSTCHAASDEMLAPPGSTCKFSCENGYVLNGNVTELKCGEEGVWDGPLPYCRKIRQCAQLNPPANGGTLACSSGNYEGSKCSFKCQDGYLLKRPNGKIEPSPGDFDITCQSDKISNFRWSGDEPYCEKVVSCPSPVKDEEKIVVKCTPPYTADSNEEFKIARNEIYSNGTTCDFSCPAETSLGSNYSTAYCSDNGEWNVTTPVSCIDGCPYFAKPENSNYSCTKDRLYNSKCTFSCEENFIMVGPSIIVCRPNIQPGQWTSPPPQCQCPSCRSGQKCENSVEFSTTWNQVNSSSPMTTIYDGREIICGSKKMIYRNDNQDGSYGCQCRDRKTNVIKQCNDGGSLSAACHRAYASVLLLLSFQGLCDLPCDAEDMPTMC